MQDRLKIYRLVPVASDRNPNRRNTPSHAAWSQRELIVRAKTAGDARIVACQAELDLAQLDTASCEGMSPDISDAFRSEKLYIVVEDNSGRFIPNGPREVVGGPVRTENPVATQL